MAMVTGWFRQKLIKLKEKLGLAEVQYLSTACSYIVSNLQFPSSVCPRSIVKVLVILTV